MKSFTKLDAVRSHNTQQKQSHDYFLLWVNKSYNSENLLVFWGVKLWAGIGINKELKTFNLYVLG